MNRIGRIPGSETMTGETCRIESALYPVSSWSSRIAACSAVSPSSTSPIYCLNLQLSYLGQEILHLLVILGPCELIKRRDITGWTVPIIKFPIGGLYCSMTTVDTGKASVFERKMARTATAMRTSMVILQQGEGRN